MNNLILFLSTIRRLLLQPILLFLSCSCLIAFGALTINQWGEKHIKLDMQETLASIGRLKAHQIQSYLAEREGDARVVSDLWRATLPQNELDKSGGKPLPVFQQGVDSIIRAYHYNSILLLDNLGNLQFASSQKGELTAAGQTIARQVSHDRTPAVSLYAGDPNAPGKAILDIFVPILNPDKTEVLNIIVMRSPPDILHNMLQSWPVKSETAEALLVIRDGNDALFLNELRHRQNTALKLRIPLNGTVNSPAWPAISAALKLYGPLEANDYHGKRVLAHTLPVPDTPWNMVVKTNLDEVLQQSYRLQWFIVTSAMLLIIFLGALISQHWLKAKEDHLANAKLQQEIGERQWAEKLLRRQEQEFRSLAENSPDHIARYDLAGHIKYMNSKCHALIELTSDFAARELVGMTTGEVYPDGRFTAYEETVKKVIESGLEAELEVEIPDIGDGIHFHLVRMVAERDEHNEITGVLAIGRDITERKAAEKWLSLLNYAFDHIKDTIVLTGEDGAIYHANTESCRALGYSYDELLGLSVQDIDLEYRQERWRAHWHELKEKGSLTFESRHKTKEGRIFPVEINANYFEFDGQSYNLGIARDITERKQYELTLFNRVLLEERLSGLAASVPGFMFTLHMTAAGHASFPFASVGIKTLFGLRPEDVRDDAALLRARYHPDDLPLLLALLEESGRTLTQLKTEARILDADTGIRWIEIRSTPQQLHGGCIEWHGLMIDITERKQVEEALAKNRQLLTEAQRIAHIGSWELNLANNTLDWSDETFRIFEIDRQQFGASYESFLEAIHPDDRESVQRAYLESLNKRAPYEFVHRLLMADGRIKYVLERCETGYAEDSKPLYSRGTVQDITERKQIEEEKQFLINILEQSADFIGSADMQGNLLYHNRGARRMIGLPEDADLSELRIIDMHPARITKLIQETVIPIALAHGEWRGESALLHRDGREIPVSQLVTLHRDINGKPAYISTIMRDVTERTRAEDEIRCLNADLEQRVQERTEELRRQTRYLRTMIDTMPMFAWLKDSDSRFLVVNQTFADACGHNVDNLVGKSVLDYWPQEYASAYLVDDAEVMASGRRKVLEEPFVDARHGNLWVETFKAPVLDVDGHVLGTVGVSRDISERKAVEAAREAALAEAERLARLRSEFMAKMSHELRTPLNGVLGYAQLLLKENRLSERQEMMIGVMQQSGEHLLSLINDVLDFAKIEAGKQELRLNDIHLPHFLRNLANIVTAKSEQKGIAFIFDIAADVPRGIRADEFRLKQVLLNLLSNAVKYSEQGTVSLRVSVLDINNAPPVSTEKKTHKVKSTLAGMSRLRFEVQDNGIGIEPGQLESIFQPFEQATNNRQHSGDGSGLGLVISRELVKLMDSDIHVSSQVGEGSCFWFNIDVPVIEIGEDALVAEQHISGYKGQRLHVLVVDDVNENRALLTDLLNRLGFETSEAANGKECLDSIESQPPDLILLDMSMPEKNGLETVRCLRRLPKFEQTPIIVVSGSISGSDVAEAMTAGANSFLNKPIDIKSLMDRIGGLLKLDWLYTPPKAEPSPQQYKPDEWLDAPPMEELKILHQLALEGSMRNIIIQTDYLSESAPSYRPFAEQLRKLARGYQSKAVLELVERYINRNPTT